MEALDTGVAEVGDAAALKARLRDADVLFVLELHADLPRAAREDRIRQRLAAAEAAGVSRAVLLSSAEVYADAAGSRGPVRETAPLYRDEDGVPEAARIALGAEQAFQAGATTATERVILRVPDLYDRTDPAALAPLRAIMFEGTAAAAPLPLQRLHPDDLSSALIAAARVPAAGGHVFNIADPMGIGPDVLAYELQRLGRLLSEEDPTDDRVRPEYPLEQPVLATDKASRLLDFRPRRSAWIGLAECAQEIVFGLRADGLVPDNTPKVPAVIAALESRSRPLAGKVCVVTGATSGIGRELAVILSRCGAHVVAVGRNATAGAELLSELEERPSCMPGEFIAADLSAMSEVRKLADTILARHARVDALINNAGAVFAARKTTADGYEATFVVNYLAPFLLTKLLVDAIPAEGHIVNLSSEIHRRSGLDFSDLFSSRNYQPLEAYARAKFANMMFSNALADRLGPEGPRVATISPGMVRTEILNREGAKDRPELAAMNRARNRMISPEKAGTYVASMLIDPKLSGLTGIYVDQDSLSDIAPATANREAGAYLWSVSEALVEMA
ncbi:NAD-dependent epimerase/dehydratase family protein [Roseivivax lentus]|uniref:NAD-dependent epimerase/dehydratase family protein n=1 Tax=Roseivivax lentus TaxID=633194 RepID=UPI0013565DA5|nr:SDR family NAD(P)-dependent oxidoreductase [Roseivivax lentus]